jgi:hypothetical protein
MRQGVSAVAEGTKIMQGLVQQGVELQSYTT